MSTETQSPRAGDGNLPPLPGAAAFIVHRAMCEPTLDWSEGDGWRNEELFTADQMRDYARAALAAAPAAAPAGQGCKHRRYSLDKQEQVGHCFDCGAEGRMVFVVQAPAPATADESKS